MRDEDRGAIIVSTKGKKERKSSNVWYRNSPRSAVRYRSCRSRKFWLSRYRKQKMVAVGSRRGRETFPDPWLKFFEKVLALFGSMSYNRIIERQERKERIMKYEFSIYTRNGKSYDCGLYFDKADEALLVAGEMAEAMAAMDNDLCSGDIKVMFYRQDKEEYQVMEKCYYLGITNESKFVKYLREGEK